MMHQEQRLIQRSTQQKTPVAIAAAPGLLSSRNLDLCLLAVCSCALTLMCHQTISLSQTTIAPSAAAQTTSVRALAQLDFNIKSGLLTSARESDTEEQK